MSERTNDPERIYLEPPPYSPEGRQWCADDVWPLDGDGPGGVEYVRADLATPEPGGEGGTLESRAYDIAHWIAMEARVAESLDRSVAPIESEGARRIVALASAHPTPAASEDVRERIVAIVRGAMDYAADGGRITEPEDYADRILALLRTPRGEDVRESEVGPSEAEMDMARTGMVIQAIKTYRERVGCTLHEARAAIDAALRSEAQGDEEDDTTHLIRTAVAVADAAPWRQSPDMDLLKSAVEEYRAARRAPAASEDVRDGRCHRKELPDAI